MMPGLKILCQIIKISSIELIVSLPGQLLGHIPITNISKHFTNRLDQSLNDESDNESNESNDDDDNDKVDSIPELDEIFEIGQFLRASVSHIHKDTSGVGRVRKEGEEVVKASRKVELTIDPQSVNETLTFNDLDKGFTLTGSVRSIEDHGYILDLGIDNVDGFISKSTLSDLENYDPKFLNQIGTILPLTVIEKPSTKVCNVTPDLMTYKKSVMNEANTLESVMPGSLLNAMITAILPNGLNVKFYGFFEGTISIDHIPYDDSKRPLSERYPIGKKLKTRVIFDHPTSNPKRFSLSILPHIVRLENNIKPSDDLNVFDIFHKGLFIHDCKIIRKESEKGLFVNIPETDLIGFIHISQIDDDHIPSLSNTNKYKIGSKLSSRVIAFSSFDNVVQLSTKPTVMSKDFMRVSDAEIGKVVDGTIKKISSDRIFISISGNVDAIIWPLHYSDIKLKHPEKKYKQGQIVKTRIINTESDKNRVTATLKKSLIKSELPIVFDYSIENKGVITMATVSSLKEKGAIVEFYGNVRAFLPVGEISESFTKHSNDVLSIGQVVKVVIIKVEQESNRMMASIRKTVPKEEREALKAASKNKESTPPVIENMQVDDNKVQNDNENDEENSNSEEDEDEENENDENDENVGLEVDEESSDEDEESFIKLDGESPKKQPQKPIKSLDIDGGFDWNADQDSDKDTVKNDASEESESDEESGDEEKRKKKRKNNKRFEGDLTAIMNEKPPESSNDFERLLLGSPNSSYLWIQYMSFQLQLSEIEKAREIGRRALKMINFRESQEKFNVWIALINLENNFGTDDQFNNLTNEAVKYNDGVTTYLKICDILESSDKIKKAEETYLKTIKKFGFEILVWISFVEFKFRIGDYQGGRSLLSRSLQSLNKRDHVGMISKFSQLEFKLGDRERGKTIFEGIIESHPKLLDQWFIYIDMLALKKQDEIISIRNVFEKLISVKLSTKKAKSVFKKWLQIEKEFGDNNGINQVKTYAIEWNEKNIQQREEKEEDNVDEE